MDVSVLLIWKLFKSETSPGKYVVGCVLFFPGTFPYIIVSTRCELKWVSQSAWCNLLNLTARLKDTHTKKKLICLLLLWHNVLYSLINALNQLEVEVVCGLLWSPCIIYKHQCGGIRLPHLRIHANIHSQHRAYCLLTKKEVCTDWKWVTLNVIQY